MTASSTFYEPYGLARSLGTVDTLSGGRFAWNVVTGGRIEEAERFGTKLLDRSARYERATEVVESCIELWKSFPAEAVVLDKQSGEFIDLEKMRSFVYEGKHVRTKGPLNVPASEQGGPVIMQAGASESGRQFAARFGEVLFFLSRSLEGMQTFYEDMHHRIEEAGRSPEDCKILVGAAVVVGETEEIARERLAYTEEFVDDDVAIDWAAKTTGTGLLSLDPDSLLDDLEIGEEGSVGYLENFMAIQADAGRPLTIREVSRRFILGNSGGPVFIGTPEQVADQMEEIFLQKGADGFVINSRVMPGWLEDFCQMVVPELQRRGLFRTEYPGSTLRDTLRGSPA